jgi:hypothetical protein
MPESSLEEYRKINLIIERDSTDATYKYALLRGTIEICEEFQHLGRIEEDKIWFPLGLLIEKWIFYYYPLIASERSIPQKSGETAEGSNHLRMAFRPLLSEVVEHYKRKEGGLSHFYNDYEKGSIPPEISGTFLSLCRKLRETITKMPMYHLGYSYSKMHNSIFQYEPKEGRLISSKTMDRDFLIQNFGEYSISTDLNEVFLYFGGFISGENTLLLKWAKFSSERSNGTISVADVMEVLTQTPETERDTWEAQQFYRQLWARKERGACVWTGKQIHAFAGCHIDHLLPFSIWKNNELWNLMPALPEINEKKSDKIPSKRLLEKRKGTILHYWDLMMQYNPILMEKEIRISLIGRVLDPEVWKEQAFEALKQKCQYLIDIRGYTEWDL